MRKKLTRALASLLCAAMLICSDGVYALADGQIGTEIVSDVSGNEEEITEDVSAGETDEETEEISEEVILGEDEAVFTDEFGYSFTYSPSMAAGLTYTVEGGVLTALTNSGNPVSGNVVIAADKGITKIGDDVFKDNTDITYVVIPAGVTEIGDNAFSGCTSLKGVSLPKGVEILGTKAFYSCTSLTQIAIPKTLNEIGNYAFANDINLYLVYSDDTIYSNLEYIDDHAFEKCSSLKYFFSDTTVTFPASLLCIGEYAFAECLSLTSLPLSENITDIGEGAFYKCSGLLSVNIPTNLQTLPARVFEDCTSLTTTNLSSSHRLKYVYEKAFYNCCSLATIQLGVRIAEIHDNAFAGCTNMVSVYIRGDAELFGEVFSDYAALGKTLYIYAYEGPVKTYTKGRPGLVFKSLDADTDTTLYSYNTQCISGDGTIIVTDADDKDISTLEGGGVAIGTTVYVTVTPKAGYVLKANSLRMNGEVLKLKDNKYSFTMPKGGALITAEFVHENDDKKINGTSVTVQFSNGDVDSENPNLVSLKVGETTKILLIDGADGSVVPAEKIIFDYADADSAKVVSVTTAGVVKALKADAAGKIVATVTGKNGNTIKTTVTIQVDAAVVDSLSLKLASYDSYITVDESMDPQIITVDTSNLSVAALTITVKATTYDSDDNNIAYALAWSTTDSNIAKLSKTSTTATSMTNKITIPKNAAGEAIVTVKATRADKSVVSKTLIIRAFDYTPRIANTTINVNLNKQNVQGTIRLLEAYGKSIVDNSIKTVSGDFVVTYIGTVDGYMEFAVKAAHSMDSKTYADKLKFEVHNGTARTTYFIPVNFVVKATLPSVKVSIDSKKAIDLLYIDDGTVVEPKITGLGAETIVEYSLEALSTKADDKKFLDNFVIDPSTGEITKKQPILSVDSKKKAVTTGYLVLKLDDFKENVVIKKKITIPVKTTAVEYVLDKSSGTVNSIAGEQTVILTVKDKKTKKAIDLSNPVIGTFNVATAANSYYGTAAEIADGKIKLTIPENLGAGKKYAYIEITNDAWATKKVTLKYTINATSSNPTVSLVSSSVTLNKLYPEKVATFKFKSNQTDTSFATAQTFKAKSTSKTAADYAKLTILYDPVTETGTVAINDNTINSGTYKFECNVKRKVNSSSLSTRTVTLSVVVSAAQPQASFGSKKITLNQSAKDVSGNYSDIAAVKLTTKKLPAGYTLNATETIDSLICSTRNNAEFADYVDAWVDGDYMKFAINSTVNNGSYTFKIKPAYTNETEDNTIYAKTISITVAVNSNTVSVSLGKAAGKLNLVDRVDPDTARTTYTDSKKLLFTKNNSIYYSPKVNYSLDKIAAVKVYSGDALPSLGNADPSDDTPESELFTATYLAGKIFITPIAEANITNSKTYKLILLYEFTNGTSSGLAGGVLSNVISVKTAQALPGVKGDTQEYKLYLSNKAYSTSFVIKPNSGKITEVAFGEKDTKALDSFNLSYVTNADGSVTVTLTLKDQVSYATNSLNDITFYVKYVNQAEGTNGVAVVRKIRINK